MKNNRLGLLLISSALIAIAAVIALSLFRLREGTVDQMRIQGSGITHSLAAIPLDALMPAARAPASVLHSLPLFYKHPSLAYIAVTTEEGKLLAHVTGNGITISSLPPLQGAGQAHGERIVGIDATDRKIFELYAPVAEGKTGAFIRTGYFAPDYLPAAKDLPFFALLALATFLLVPVVYLLLKHEMQPLGGVVKKLLPLLPQNTPPGSAGGKLISTSDLAAKLQDYIHHCQTRIEELENERASLLTSNRLLQYNSNKLNHVLHCLPDGLLILDPAGHINFVSEKVQPLLGIDSQAILNDPLDKWCRDSSLKALLRRHMAASAQGVRPETIEISPENLQDKRIRVSTIPLVNTPDGTAFGTLLVVHDATSEFFAQQASHDFIAHVSHELKSPLNVIGMYCEMLQEDNGKDQALRIDATNVIHDEVERMVALVNNLLNISKMETGGFQPARTRVRTEDLLQDIYRNLLPRAEGAGVSMDLKIQKEISPILVDKEMVRIAINNLLTNAVKYNQPGGKVMLDASENDTEIVITVRDNGIGIPDSDQPHVFRKFYRAQTGDGNKRSGHGLGLYLANEIIQLHQGRIMLESIPGKGSTFSIHLKKASVVNREMNVL